MSPNGVKEDAVPKNDPLYGRHKRRQQEREEKPAFRETAIHGGVVVLEEELPNTIDDNNSTNCSTNSSTATAAQQRPTPKPSQQTTKPPPSWRQVFQDTLFHRFYEKQAILGAFEELLEGWVSSPQRSPNTNNMIMVTGASGTGKTRLVQTTLQPRATYFLNGKFDQPPLRPQPYAAFVTAFTEFTHQLLLRGPQTVQDFRVRIQETIGDEACVLWSMIPALEPILLDSTSQTVQQKTSTFKTADTIQRFIFVFRQFMRCVCSPAEPMVLLLDDLHWADPCSLDLLYSIVTDLDNNPGLCIIGTCDPTVQYVTADTNNKSYLSKKLQDMEKHMGRTIMDVPVENFSRRNVQHLLRTALRREDCADLEEIISTQTQGNVYYIIEFLTWLQEGQLMTFDQERQAWTWDGDQIRMSLTSQCVSGFMRNKLSQIPVECLDTLKVAACFGSNLDETLIEYVMDQPVANVLQQATKRGLMVFDTTRQTYSFGHDGMQKLVYSMIPESGRELFHLEVGRRLWRHLKTDQLDRHLFAVLSQMNIGKRLITRERERYSVASLCLSAGIKAASTSTFRMASTYLNLGMDLLGASGWFHQYDLTLAVYNAAAEMEMCITNFDAMNAIVDCVLEHAKPGDTVQALSTRLYALGVTDRSQEALDLGIKMLAELDEYFPRKLCVFHMMSEMKSVRKLIGKQTNEQLLRLPPIEDKKKLAALQICNLMFLQALMVRPKLGRFIALKSMKITLQYGMSMLAPGTLASFGMACVTRLKDLDAAVRFGDLALEALKLYDGKEYYPRVYAAYYGCLYSMKGPMRESLDPLLQGYRIGMQTGDYEYAFLNANLYCFNGRDCGLPLPLIEDTWAGFQSDMASLKQDTLLGMSNVCMQSTQHLMGLTTEFFSEKADYETDQILQSCIENKQTTHVVYVCMTRMLMHFLFCDYDLAHKYSQKMVKNLWMLASIYDVANSFYLVAMVALARAHDKNKDCGQARARAREALKYLEPLSRMCPANYSLMKFLVKAEVAACHDAKEALEHYTVAIALSNQYQDLMRAGMANERAARFFVRAQNTQEAEPYFRKALARYNEWGAKAKVDQLKEELVALYGE